MTMLFLLGTQIGMPFFPELCLGFVWIQLKTEKNCSKIIFECVNNTVGPIFNEKCAKFVGL